MEIFHTAKTKGRKKRFIHQSITEQIFSGPERSNDLLTLHYTVDDNGIIDGNSTDQEKKNKEFRKVITLATRSLNRLGILTIKPAVKTLGDHLKRIPFNLQNFKRSYGNIITFSFEDLHDNSTTCMTYPSYKFNVLFSSLSVQDPAKSGNSTFPLKALYTIACNPQKLLEEWKGYAPGILVHELMHTFGILHTHHALIVTKNRIQNLLISELSSDDWNSNEKRRERYEKLFGHTKEGEFPLGVNYDLASPFSIMHYRVGALAPEIYFNTTAIRELLITNDFSQELISYYFKLFENVGHPCLLTYQDILSLAIRVWQIARGSLSSRIVQLPHLLFIEGVYLAPSDKLKGMAILNKIIQIQKFNYPILHKKNVTILLPCGKSSINLIERAELASLEGPLSCAIRGNGSPPSRCHLKIDLALNCFLRVNSRYNVGSFRTEIVVYNNRTRRILGVELLFKRRTISDISGIKEEKIIDAKKNYSISMRSPRDLRPQLFSKREKRSKNNRKDNTYAMQMNRCTRGSRYGESYVEGITCYTRNAKVMVFLKDSNVKIEKSADRYSKQSCRPVEFNSLPSVYCEGKRTNIVYTPDIPQHPLEQLNDQLMLLQVVLHQGKNIYTWFQNLFSKKNNHDQLLKKIPATLSITDDQKASWKEALDNIEKRLTALTDGNKGKMDLLWAWHILADRKEEFKAFFTRQFAVSLEEVYAFTENLQALMAELEVVENLLSTVAKNYENSLVRKTDHAEIFIPKSIFGQINTVFNKLNKGLAQPFVSVASNSTATRKLN